MPAGPIGRRPGAVFVADVLGAIFAYGAIQSALLQRVRTGEGQHVDVALMDSMLNLLVYELQEAQFPVPTPRPTYGRCVPPTATCWSCRSPPETSPRSAR
jgi:crotonobetainyl-CoA:carnitine CoA-transferase CaiB-like acyl-CoA transferase